MVKFLIMQESILAPLLFLFYIPVNDFLKSLRSGNAIMFSGGTNLFINSSSYRILYEATNSKLKDVQAWLPANKLTLLLACKTVDLTMSYLGAADIGLWFDRGCCEIHVATLGSVDWAVIYELFCSLRIRSAIAEW